MAVRSLRPGQPAGGGAGSRVASGQLQVDERVAAQHGGARFEGPEQDLVRHPVAARLDLDQSDLVDGWRALLSFPPNGDLAVVGRALFRQQGRVRAHVRP